jgi:hypothetical protein
LKVAREKHGQVEKSCFSPAARAPSMLTRSGAIGARLQVTPAMWNNKQKKRIGIGLIQKHDFTSSFVFTIVVVGVV